MSFQYFLKRVSALKFSLNATEWYEYNIEPSVESIKLMTIIEAKKGQNVKRKNCATLNYLGYRDLNQIIIDKDGNRIRGSFDQESL